jgi:hypothetical protein
MTDYRATPEQWADVGSWAKESPSSWDACLLELRARVQSLEVNTGQWRLDHLRLANICASLAPDRRAFFYALLPDDEDSQPTPNPSQIRSSLVDRVARAIGRDDEPINWEPEAHAAIREVAAWLDENTGGDAAWMLTQEAGR